MAGGGGDRGAIATPGESDAMTVPTACACYNDLKVAAEYASRLHEQLRAEVRTSFPAGGAAVAAVLLRVVTVNADAEPTVPTVQTASTTAARRRRRNGRRSNMVCCASAAVWRGTGGTHPALPAMTAPIAAAVAHVGAVAVGPPMPRPRSRMESFFYGECYMGALRSYMLAG